MPDGVNLPAPAATKSRGLSQAEREAAAELAASGDTTTTIVDISKPKPPTTIAGAAVLINADTNEIYFEQNADNWMHPASTTKMVTLLTALRLKGTELDRLATISPYAASMEPSVLGVRPGDQISLEGILEGMMTVSGNDAAVVAAENVSGSVAAFAQEMNKTAKMAGATQSNFLNPHGLTEQGHHTTARDLAKIAAYGMRIPMFRDMVANDYYNVPYQNRPQETVRTTNLFIRNKYPGANGLKTGYTQAAGDCLIASATRDGHTMIAVFLNDDDRWTDAVKFLDYGFA
ncbi:MAG: D-alanyl-D-alanine carboxypeptidase, partial [Veillonella sp.]|nr:D-alanyl-D-alanine carboxypeptidase [Veillonella sp.]